MRLVYLLLCFFASFQLLFFLPVTFPPVEKSSCSRVMLPALYLIFPHLLRFFALFIKIQSVFCRQQLYTATCTRFPSGPAPFLPISSLWPGAILISLHLLALPLAGCSTLALAASLWTSSAHIACLCLRLAHHGSMLMLPLMLMFMSRLCLLLHATRQPFPHVQHSSSSLQFTNHVAAWPQHKASSQQHACKMWLLGMTLTGHCQLFWPSPHSVKQWRAWTLGQAKCYAVLSLLDTSLCTWGVSVTSSACLDILTLILRRARVKRVSGVRHVTSAAQEMQESRYAMDMGNVIRTLAGEFTCSPQQAEQQTKKPIIVLFLHFFILMLML